MKKLLITIMVALLTCTLGFTLTSCGPSDNETAPEGNNETEKEETEDVGGLNLRPTDEALKKNK